MRLGRRDQVDQMKRRVYVQIKTVSEYDMRAGSNRALAPHELCPEKMGSCQTASQQSRCIPTAAVCCLSKAILPNVHVWQLRLFATVL